MLRLNSRRNGNEAKSACEKVLARTPISLRIGAIVALSTICILLSLICFGPSRRNPYDSIVESYEIQDSQPVSQPVRPGLDEQKRRTHAEKHRRLKKGRRSADDGESVAAPDAARVEGAIRPEMGRRPNPNYHHLLTSDQHIYTGADIPYFDEDVPSFKSRVSRLLSASKKDSIFVSLGSFRDDLCPATLLELFNKARHPGKIVVGLVDQVKLAPDSDDVACDSSLPLPYRRQVRLVRLTSLEGRGPTHARYIASKLYEGEQYYMQIDSHSHFKQDWDLIIRQQLIRLPNPARSIITHYPPGDVAELEDKNPPWICSNRQHKDAPPGLLVQESDWCYPENRSPGVAVASDGSLTTCVSPFMGGGFIIGPGAWVLDVPYDKYLPYIFHGEELLIAARLWTSGWDMFTPSENILDHKYGGRDKNVYAETTTWTQIGELSTARARHILGTTLPGDDQIAFDKSELQYLGMGTERSYSDYLEFAGINLEGNSTGRCGQRFNWDTKQWEGRVKPMTG